MNRQKYALIALFMVQLLYGLNYTFAKVVINDNFIKPFSFVLLRVGGAAILFWLFGLFYKQERIELKDYVTLFFAAVFGVATNMLLFLKGLELTSPIHASVIMTITPIIILILSSFFLSEKITRLKVLGVFLGFLGGILLTILGKSTRVGDNVPLGNTLIFINAISYSIYIIIIKKLTAKYHPFTFIKWLFLFGFFLVLPFGYQETLEIDWQSFTPYAWFSVLFVVIGATFGTYILNPLALRSLKASTVGVFIYLQPVIAGIFAIMMGVDAVSPVKIAAMLLIFAGVYLVTKKPKVLT
ncbi:DMT family transporter [Psychroserpens sp.]|uniref:DMT family transporter n=1 Tax=Psychroserpens sp. TaxID=2020870 RepID=UPI001B075CEC|nr:DMT family transporter [Psychroserpens sp.]MBO6605528.1 DMT family transporter [Psychroserpens sp.]MBO6653663.1 DMT family transporter [Psychroserpens sp.]MBO6681984.1 DMT family transporter [Psychroserpens sp.]MBO6748902.1 DMT family transporter [Psychroserpens sp.]MBO6915421.1 DMT family transporter [Psychroserpens sp.]